MKHAYGLGGKWVVPALILIVTTIYLVEALKMAPPIQGGDITASFFPVLLAVIMYLSIVVVLWQGRNKRDGHDTDDSGDEAKATETGERQFGALWVTLLTGVYIGVFSVIGYSLSTFLYVFLLTFIFGERGFGKGGKAWIVKILAAAIITLLGYALFELIFQVRLPTLWT
ncbi:tripartite tricarboxylate transporter TctB family protein [Aidingimonas lacisalsi]|uniref:tripartite tricarboxylate transporter TctB family protein n=1 Tax=Aidingimonas lacisalsi TaxID=2604086 RepID=UPI0011D1F9B0|nr:tripartite tricarboxylate transporter TctB family protein [Aidingimonas lacisalsi]